jgi:L-amino acid N-acyltransferase YncA
MMVNYKYIGNGLQYQMLEVLDNYFTDNNLKYALGTIHPENSYSINNALKSGYEFSSCKVFPRGIRNVYIKKY